MKKVKVIIISLLASLFTYLAMRFSWNLYVTMLCIFWFYYIAIYWILERDIHFLGLFTILLFPSLMMSTLCLSLLVYAPGGFTVIPVGIGTVLMPLAFVGIITFAGYALIISMNVFNVSRYRRLPLLQAAQTIVYLVSFVGGYMILNLIHHFYATDWYILIPLYILTGGFLIFMNNWSIKVDLKESLLYVLLGMFIIAQLTIVLSFFPLVFYVYPLSVTLCIYIFNGVLIHSSKRNTIRRSLLEYALLCCLILAVILFTSEWGVAGNIIGL